MPVFVRSRFSVVQASPTEATENQGALPAVVDLVFDDVADHLQKRVL